MENYEAIIALILGLFVCLFGYKLKKIVFFIAWFIIGYTLTLKLLPLINTYIPQVADEAFWQGMIPVFGGLLLSILGFSIEKLCVSLLCFFSVIAIAFTQFGVSWEVFGIASVVGVFVGAAAVFMMKPATILVTAIAGASVATDAFLALAPAVSASTYYLPILIGAAALGSIFQFVNNKRN